MAQPNPDLMKGDAIVGEDGRVLLFQCERFIRDICEGDACFICGARPGEREFNDEHIVPKWILRRYGLFNREITLPTGERRKYAGYKVPCCEPCNTLLGRVVETPVSKLLEGDFSAVSARLEDSQSRELLFIWVMPALFEGPPKGRTNTSSSRSEAGRGAHWRRIRLD